MASSSRPRLSSSALPMDLLLEISARSDPVTLVRCAATCKVLRRHIADPAFHLSLRLGHSDRFVPRLLHGFFMQNKDTDGYEDPPKRSLDLVRSTESSSAEPFRSFLSKLASLFPFGAHGVAASHGLVALRADPDTAGLSVFNPMTGYLHMFGRLPGINAQSFALFTRDGDGDGLYRLLAAELAPGRLKTQTFSQAAGKWLAVEETTVAPCPQDAVLLHRPLVLQGGDVHWLCRSSECHFILRFSPTHTAVSVTKIDGDCGEQLLGRRPEELLLVSDDGSGHGRQPRLLVATGLEISLWTLLSGEASWSMQVLVMAETIRRPAETWSERLQLRWFGEKSGMVLVRMAGAQETSPPWYFVLELATRKVRGGVCTGTRSHEVLFPYEMDVSFWRPTFPHQL